ncbi:MAG: UDP-N-acetylmuramoyl-L-alanine--D-glutamate ligase [Thermincolia bacterium]
MELRNKKVLIIGMARSGVAAARFCRDKGAVVTAYDGKLPEQIGKVADELGSLGITLSLGVDPVIAPGAYHLAVISPGVPPTISVVGQLKKAGIPLIGEIELAYGFAKAPIVAITGTNGKTTTTTLIGEIFRDAGRQTCVAGNIGLPFIEEVEKYSEQAVLVLEVSSFQMETVDKFKAKVGMILNITPDHLDRHETMENYALAKSKVFANQGLEDFSVLNYDDPQVLSMAVQTGGRVIFFSRKHKLEEGVSVDEGQIVVKWNGQTTPICAVNEVSILGAHNLENALAAVAAGWVMGVKADSLAWTLKRFQGVAHRMEAVAEIEGVKFINDSKGTNPDAAIKALESFNEPIVLIAGGKNKGLDFTEFALKIKEKVRSLVLVGEAAPAIREAVVEQGFTDSKKADSFEEAVKMAAREARPGEIVLLSPACTSWDMFNNFEERGDLFKQVVYSLRR